MLQRAGFTRLFAMGALALLSASASRAAIDFVDITDDVNLRHQAAYGSTFSGISEVLQMMQRNMGNGVAVGDYDNDGDLDVYLLGQLDQPNVLLRNEWSHGLIRFTDVTDTAGVQDFGLSRVAHFVDLDNDGWRDLLLVNDDDGSDLYPTSKIFRNDGDGSFTDVTAGSGFRPIGMLRCGASLADMDGDGLLDVYVTNWSNDLNTGNPQFPGENRLYRNLGNFVFDDITVTARLSGLTRDSFTAIFTDFDFDNDADIYVAIDHSADKYYENSGNSTFDDHTQLVNADHYGNDMGAACADFDDDGDLDVYVTNITDPDLYYGTGQGNVFYVNQWDSGGAVSFINEANPRGVEDSFWGWGTVFGDVENDGDLDLIAVTGFDEFVDWNPAPSSLYQTPSVLFENDGTGNFSRWIPAGFSQTLDSRGLARFDYDRDGDQDLLITNTDQSAVLLENRSDSGNWLDLRLVQTAGGNRDAIGATVYATNGSKTRRRDVLCGDSYLTGNPAEVHIGVGAATTIDELRVVWTDGSETTYTDVAVNRRVTLTQGVADADVDGTGDGDDCAPADPLLWSPPSAIDDLVFESRFDLFWGRPDDPGSETPRYDLLQSIAVDSFAAASCLAVDTAEQRHIAPYTPGPGQLAAYLARAFSGCGSTVGAASAGPRTLPVCP